jgi:peptidyl-dipeptidase A
MKKILPFKKLITIAGLASAVIGCNVTPEKNSPSSEQARKFIEKSESYLYKSVDRRQYAWNNWHRFKNIDSQNHFYRVMGEEQQAITDNSYQSTQFIGTELNEDMTFRFNRIRSRLSNPSPKDEKSAAKLARLSQSLQTQHNKPCESDKAVKGCLPLLATNEVMSGSNDTSELLQVWQSSREANIPMRLEFSEKVELNNLGAQRMGYENIAEMRSARAYQMPAAEFTKELDRVWQQISPLYESLQCHVKAKLADKYGNDIVKQDMPIPAHLIGDLIGGSFANLYDDVVPTGTNTNRGYDLTERLVTANYTEVDLLRAADKFNASMGFTPLDESFYSESTFTKPDGYDVECGSGLWLLRETNQSRLIACYNVTAEDFTASHKEVIQHLYWKGTTNQPIKHNGFPTGLLHGTFEAAKLLVSPSYLNEIGLLDEVPDESADLGFLIKLALDEVSSIPFKILVDKWRWAVASGEIAPKDYNSYWWQLRQQYQGIAPPITDDTKNNARDYFDAGVVTAVINNQELSISAVQSISAFQIYKNICDASGNTEILSRCSTFNSKEAGNKLKALYNMGNSKPWAETLAAWADEKQLDGSALVEYFAPLQTYLNEQNKGLSCRL